MREQLIRYVDLLFAGTSDAGEIKQEILQNTLDRYDDLIAQGKTPACAYRLAISGIGDINEIVGDPEAPTPPPAKPQAQTPPVWKRILRAVSVGLYIMCPIPLFVLQNELGLCGLLAICAVATVLSVLGGKAEDADSPAQSQPRRQPHDGIRAALWLIALAVYFVVSFSTGAWYITWVIFLIAAAVHGLIRACMDLKEAN